MKKWFILLILIGCNLSVLSSISPSEREILISFYNATGGDSWTNKAAGSQHLLIQMDLQCLEQKTHGLALQ